MPSVLAGGKNERILAMTQETAQTPRGLRRTLRPRHLTMIALGGSIGTGLFLASGATISQAGALGALAAYALIGAMVYFLMTGLAELAAYEPVTGSFATYGTKYVDEGFGFAIGINYWYNWAIAVAVDMVAVQIVMAYWFPAVPGVVWSGAALLSVFLLNAFSVKSFGEAEFWFASVKVVTIIVFIITGLLIFAGAAAPDYASAGFENLTWDGGIAAFMGAAMVVGYSFQGTELVGTAAGESADPRRAVPRAVKSIFWRILLFYILSVAVIGLLIPHTDPRLLKNDLGDIAVSPFTLVFENAGLAAAAALMNAVILTTILSAGNSGMYAASRMLYTLALEGRAPAVFARLTGNGVPLNALIATTAIAGLCFLTSIFSDQTVYLWLLNTTGMGGFILWLAIAVSHYRFRRGYVLSGGRVDELPYAAGFFPWGSVFAFAVCFVITRV